MRNVSTLKMKVLVNSFSVKLSLLQGLFKKKKKEWYLENEVEVPVV